jgi:hypothetical protein
MRCIGGAIEKQPIVVRGTAMLGAAGVKTKIGGIGSERNEARNRPPWCSQA